jgi:hypothetical protein
LIRQRELRGKRLEELLAAGYMEVPGYTVLRQDDSICLVRWDAGTVDAVLMFSARMGAERASP